ncbi:MAG TPA: twin-arginine translocation signal domain-containing protein, partial [Puia sp.]
MNQRLPRREFLKLSGAATLGAALLPAKIFDLANSPSAKIALQLYTVRKELEKDMTATLHRLASIGLKTVETAFWPTNVTAKDAAKKLKDAGLQVSSCHVEIPVGDKKTAMLQTAEAFDCKYMIWHGWPEDK